MTTRRTFLKASAALGALASLPACNDLYVGLAQGHDPAPGPYALGRSAAVDPDFHFLSRTTYGPRPGDLATLREMGRTAWLEEQLRPESIGNRGCEIRAAQCASVHERPADLMSVREKHIDRDMTRNVLIRAVHSRRQLQEVMVGFWRDHLSIDLGKQGCEITKPLDDREVLYGHCFGRFRDLIRASALSPAMLAYLDGRMNKRSGPGDEPNENYARELLELHTLGVHGGYTQKDVMEAARCLTGWTTEKRWFKGLVVHFQPDAHDDGEKVVLGRRIPAGGGEQDLDTLLDIVCSHPSTARHIATKLCRRFVSDPAPETLVASTAAVFTESEGDLRQILRHILGSPEFEASTGLKVKRPLRFMASALRATGAECRAGKPEIRALERLGHVPFHYPTPDGYPEEPEPWMGGLLWRWNFALALTTGRLEPTKTDLAALARRCGMDPETDVVSSLAPVFLGRAATPEERAVVDAYAEAESGAPELRREAVALILSTPAFQVY